MSSFTSPLIVIPLLDGRRWQLHRSFVYHIGSKYNKSVIKVPAGFVTDFASTDILQWVAVFLTVIYVGLSLFTAIPARVGIIFLAIILAGLLITPYGKPAKAAVLHDYLYKNHLVSRRMADLIFYEAMLVGGTLKWKAKVMYYAVRSWGWLAWKGNTNHTG